MRVHTLLLLAGLMSSGSPAPAHGANEQDYRGRGIGLSLSVTPFQQFRSDLDGGGNLDVSRIFSSLGTRRQIGEGLSLGLSLSYDLEDYNFSGNTDLLSRKPWDKIHRPGLGAFLSYESGNGWKTSIGPRIEFSRESGAGWQDSLSYGALFTLSRQLHPGLELGFGLGAFKRVEKNSVFPVLKVDWRITERLRLSNPLRAGPAGPAGLALSYTPDKRWEFALGGSYRRFRFRLDDSGPAPDGVGEAALLPVFARATRKFGPVFRIDAYAGAAFGGQLRLEDEDGDQLRADRHDTAPILGLTLSGRF